MDAGKEELIQAVNESGRELQEKIDRHCLLIAEILEGKAEPGWMPAGDFSSARARELKLKEALKEAISVLEKTRSSFKSKQLEVLRKKLTQTLIDME